MMKRGRVLFMRKMRKRHRRKQKYRKRRIQKIVFTVKIQRKKIEKKRKIIMTRKTIQAVQMEQTMTLKTRKDPQQQKIVKLL